MKYGYLAVEGPHDLAFAGQLLKLHGLERVKMYPRLDAFWRPLVPTKFPHQDDLLKRVPVPTFFASATHSIAVHTVGGDSGFARTIKDSLDVLYMEEGEPPLTGLGILLDADSKDPPAKRHAELSQELGLTTYPIALAFPLSPGAVSTAKTHCGIFVLPDNQSRGTLEALLLECAKIVYPTLTVGAQTYIDLVPGAKELVKSDRKDLDKPAGRDKAMVACIAAVLRPGKAIQVSIQDNRWVEPPLARFPRITAIDDFFVSLFEL
ncbi:MAG: DUF3226 domain-containing protein [Byssovorax sp.]